MPILSSQLDSIGQAGQVPRIVYLQTDDSASDIVSDPSYLNHFIAQGNVLTPNEIALVVTKASPSAQPVCSFFQITKSGSNWSMASYANPIPTPPAGSAWVDVTGTSQLMEAGVSYVASSGSLITFSLPASPSFGDVFEIVGTGSGQWTVAIPSGQSLQFTTGVSTTSSVDAANQYDSFAFVCVVGGASARYVARHAQGPSFILS